MLIQCPNCINTNVISNAQLNVTCHFMHEEVIRSIVLSIDIATRLNTCINLHITHSKELCKNILQNKVISEESNSKVYGTYNLCVNCLSPVYYAHVLYPIAIAADEELVAYDTLYTYHQTTDINIFEKYFKVPHSQIDIDDNRTHNKVKNKLIDLYFEQAELNSYNLRYNGEAQLTPEQLKHLYKTLWSINLNELTTEELLCLNGCLSKK